MRKLPPLGSLRAFEAAARHLSFKNAADELGLTPTAISHQVRMLEEHCGERLFRRRPRPLALTPAGTALYPAIRGGFEAFADALEALGDKSEPTPLRVTTTNAFASRWLVPRLGLWRDAHPDLPLTVIGTDRVVRLADEADIAIRYARTAPSGSVAPEMFRDRFFAVCAPKLLSGRPPVRRPGDLAAFPLIQYDWFAPDPTAPTWRRWLDMAAEADPAARELGEIALGFREELHAVEAVLAGQGIAICSDIVVADDLASGALVKVLDLSLPGYGFYPVFEPNHRRRAVIEMFVDWISDQARRAVDLIDSNIPSTGRE
jgi:LysR family transcriptional regulator, glycine cleavage system transcriptional activator